MVGQREQLLEMHAAAERAALAALALAGLGMLLACSVAAAEAGFGKAFIGHALKLVVGTGLMLALTRVRPRGLSLVAPYTFFASLFLVLVAAFAMPSLNGASRWIFLPGKIATFQPAEFAKVALIIYTAYLASRARRTKDYYLGFVPGSLLALGLVLQPDVGSALLCLTASAAILFAAGFPWRHAGVLGLLVGLFLLAAFLCLPHVQNRFSGFLNPKPASQVGLALLATSSGGLFGTGLGAGAVKLGHLPQCGNDFIFAVLGEELGLAGCLGVLLLLVLFVREGFRVAGATPDRFLGLVAFGAVFSVAFQALAHVAVNTAMAPAKGIDFPLLGSGGSSLCFALGAVGLLRAVGRAGGSSLGERMRAGTAMGGSMPNVERYGVLALCFLIVVILGVSLWGPEESSTPARIEPTSLSSGTSLRESDPELFPTTGGSLAERSSLQPDPGAGSGQVSRPGLPPAPRLGGVYYSVRSGDSLWKIAKRHYGTAGCIPLILEGNPGLTEKSRLQLGQRLLLPHRKPATQ